MSTALTITSIQFHKKVTPLRIAFKHGSNEHTHSRCTVLEVKTSQGHSSFGEIQARSYLTGETLESAEEFVRDMMEPRLRLSAITDQASLQALLEDLYLRADCSRFLASYCSVEWALLQAYAKQAQIELNALVRGLFPNTSRSENSSPGQKMSAVPILSSPMAELVGFGLYLLGNSAIKMKVSPESWERVLPQARRLRFFFKNMGLDANGAVTPQKWLELAPVIRESGFDFIEQPTTASEESSWKKIADLTHTTILADESLCTLSDAKRLLENPGCRGWNLRLAKVGGFCGLSRLLKLARQNELRCHLGSLVGETRILENMFQLANEIYEFDFVEPPMTRYLLTGRY